MRTTVLRLTLAASAAVLAACAAPAHQHEHGPGKPGMPGGMHGGTPGGMHGANTAIATLGPTQGNGVRGIVMFHQQADGTVMVHARVSGLKPGAEHGFHVHDKGDCASPDGMSAAGHFNPGGHAHGPQGGTRHAGDMPNLKADAAGLADQKFRIDGITVKDGATAVNGRSVIVHVNPDDYTSQPTGNAGGRLACGVIVAPH